MIQADMLFSAGADKEESLTGVINPYSEINNAYVNIYAMLYHMHLKEV